eukprot:scaffold918_cov390-Pavlova_lutheri.AAC.1
MSNLLHIPSSKKKTLLHGECDLGRCNRRGTGAVEGMVGWKDGCMGSAHVAATGWLAIGHA